MDIRKLEREYYGRELNVFFLYTVAKSQRNTFSFQPKIFLHRMMNIQGNPLWNGNLYLLSGHT